MTGTVHEMTKEKAIVRLCEAARTSADPEFLRAVCIAAKCLARAGIHKRRNHASRAVYEAQRDANNARNLAARKADKGAFYTPDAILADPPFVTPAPAPLSPDVPPMTEPSAPAPDAAEPQTQE